ncbi:hypothetical protein [Fluviicola sp.]|uniref:hypothetical protein n=1 Tax=Fluviicola sp. TaxID=1917219 RepID=UPI0026235DC0|nr:hypothetical protein [Fluviicola sp.]
MKRTFLLSILILCFSCGKAKDDKQKYKQSITGDWDWVDSESGSNGGTSAALITYSPSTTSTNYGLRIRSSNNAFLYENGKQIKKGKLEGIEQVPYTQYGGGKTAIDYRYVVTFKFDGETFIFTNQSPTGLTCTTWPYNNHSNNFKKI